MIFSSRFFGCPNLPEALYSKLWEQLCRPLSPENRDETRQPGVPRKSSCFEIYVNYHHTKEGIS